MRAGARLVLTHAVAPVGGSYPAGTIVVLARDAMGDLSLAELGGILDVRFPGATTVERVHVSFMAALEETDRT